MHANCKTLGGTVIIPISNDNSNKNSDHNSKNPNVLIYTNADEIDLDSFSLYVEDICSYVAGFVVKTLEKN